MLAHDPPYRAVTAPGVRSTTSTDGDRDRVVVVGAGIVGLATARALLEAGFQVTVLDKEAEVGRHQSGHNSGVLHAGLYYRPGSAKARFCREGRSELEAYAAARDLPAERCGKVVVATQVAEIEALRELRDRGRANGLDVTWLDRRGLAEHEPHADGVAALFVAATGVTDFGAVCRSLRDDLCAAGAHLHVGTGVETIEEHADGVHVTTTGGRFTAGALVNCAGLQSDRIARAAGCRPDVVIVPFRGEYLEVQPGRAHLVRHLIYPVPDPRFPFLGVHLSRGVDGKVHAGPNAVLATAREGYRWSDVRGTDLRELAADPRLWRLARRYWRTGLSEIARSWSRTLMARQVRRLVPDLRASDLRPSGSGVRAQAVGPDGTLIDDFALIETPRMVHVLNAPSPGATASLALGRWIASRLAIDPNGRR
jgi:L-2-hydroxyglutarate oxidase